ncbi:YlxM family DNA-binding protein [Anaerocolumna sp. AGMB13025]|uniref:YlxM family DNA-binding protein n=1 Tax=Anaerocolumna sp. AGMB13025 TaxID=3039116 RepID=UPI00241E9F49|nr:YlxM family DNA-binding protein [Anaerocolumna sp. AGMB13025]WFR54822.1 YlxM family DNA-binding protein [Anaerocolumna sp. AGMB13025]
MDDMIMDDKLKEKVELSILFDFYGELLKNHNKQIFEDYILNDLSLSEIAEEQGISRQGVYDIVKRCSKQLKECEEKLNLVKKFEETKALVNRIKALSEQMKISGKLTGLEDIIILSDNIMKDL